MPKLLEQRLDRTRDPVVWRDDSAGAIVDLRRSLYPYPSRSMHCGMEIT